MDDFASRHYTPRAADYVTSTVHATGADLSALSHLLSGRSVGRLLDLGCGGGHVSYAASPHVASVTACDPTNTMLENVARTAEQRGLGNIETMRAAAETLPFSDNSFDAVVTRYSAHHWSDVVAGLSEARRVLKPGGLGVFMDVVAPRDPRHDSHLQTVELLRDASHVRDYTVAEWLAFLSVSGFAVASLRMDRLQLDFASWVARTRTPELYQQTIRAVQSEAHEDVRHAFDIGPDGTFAVDTVFIVTE